MTRESIRHTIVCYDVWAAAPANNHHHTTVDDGKSWSLLSKVDDTETGNQHKSNPPGLNSDRR